MSSEADNIPFPSRALDSVTIGKIIAFGFSEPRILFFIL